MLFQFVPEIGCVLTHKMQQNAVVWHTALLHG